MEKNRNVKILSIVALVVAIAGMTLGFAAFSTTLSISSSATVTPNSDDFKITIYGIKDSSFYDTFADNNYAYTDSDISDSYGVALEDTATSTTASIDNVSHTISNINASFSNEGDVQYAFIIKNEGKYDAYLDLTDKKTGSIIAVLLNKNCIAKDGATESLVTSACNGVQAAVGFVDKETGREISTTESYYKITSGDYVLFTVMMNYSGPFADGPFDVEFEDFQLKFSTTK